MISKTKFVHTKNNFKTFMPKNSAKFSAPPKVNFCELFQNQMKLVTLQKCIICINIKRMTIVRTISLVLSHEDIYFTEIRISDT